MTNEQMLREILVASFKAVEASGEEMTQEEVLLRVEEHARAVLTAYYAN